MKSILLTFSLFIPFLVSGQWILKNSNSPQSSWLSAPGVVNNKAYLIPRSDTLRMYEYDPASNTYAAKANSGLDAGFNTDCSFTINDTVYLLQLQYPFHTKAYNVNTDTWTDKDQTSNNLNAVFLAVFPPSTYGMVFNGSLFSFSYNNKGYFAGLTLMDLTTSTEFIAPFIFEYNPVSDTYQPINISDFGFLYNMLFPTTFEMGNKIYIVGGARNPSITNLGIEVIEFDPATNTVVQKTSCNCGQLSNSASFVLDTLAYVNVNNDCPNITSLQPIMTYNPANDTWAYHSNLPTQDTAYLYTGFSINGKGYIGIGNNLKNGCTNVVANTDLYEYSPEIVSVAEYEKSAITIFPNPATNNFTITNLVDASQVQIYNSLGEIVYQKNVNDPVNLEISIPNAGIYFVKVTTEKTIFTKKIILCD